MEYVGREEQRNDGVHHSDEEDIHSDQDIRRVGKILERVRDLGEVGSLRSTCTDSGSSWITSVRSEFMVS